MPEIVLKELSVDGWPAVSATGELNISTAPELREALVKHLRRREPLVVLNLSGLQFMDTSGLATLIEAHLQAERYGGKLALVGLQPRIKEVLDVTHVTALFHIFATEDGAVKALKEE